jgi:Ca2+-binding EF-hand superfamily protein
LKDDMNGSDSDNSERDECIEIEEGLSEKEFLAIRQRFSRYDFALCNEIRISDIEDLLTDLGGGYSKQELEVIEDNVNYCRLGLCSFKDFLRWWCES